MKRALVLLKVEWDPERTAHPETWKWTEIVRNSVGPTSGGVVSTVALNKTTRTATERVRTMVLREIERRTKAHAKLLGEKSGGAAYRAALDDLAGWLEGADREELLGVDP